MNNDELTRLLHRFEIDGFVVLEGAINIHPGETPQPWHHDDGAGGLPWPGPRPRLGVSTIWAFDDFTVDNGATEVIPGSHL